MAPVLAAGIGPETGFLTHGQADIIAWGGLAAVTTFLVLTLLLILCSSCDREKKPKHQNGDHENLMTAPSDKETFSHSITSLGTEPPANSYRNGGIGNGDVISEDSTTACIQPYEEVQTSYPELCDQQDYAGKSIRCPQSRELPRIPPNSNLENVHSARPVENYPSHGTEGPYEVLKDSSSHDNIIEDSLYETVKEIKEVSVASCTEASRKVDKRATSQNTQDKNPECRVEAAEYASINRNRKSQQRVSAECAVSSPVDQEDEAPPPVPEKLLDENENVQRKEADQEEEEENDTEEASQIAAMYSTVSKPVNPARTQDEASHPTYSQEDTTPRSPSICSDLYATVRDYDKSPNLADVPQASERLNGESDPEYEAIPSVSQEDGRTASVANANQAMPMLGENDYESIGDLQQNGDTTRL
ncbi:phosphoprotein associated with glycosphingolipid-enriched microdomains 1 isoform X2 [Rhinatrema bivittatum]|uniref:phosphoprotein associated with glycosphingolipid-enriched microdomains 1 isoform X2 n=1 Tax=Rhinatrema bivittatum TaxID=194408 RepID=UPI00112DBBD7|nr:phosphoprotein associated with glycosphingolipid-enriched microdomains 1 isoform X2 [Rhinatrema bivittatum]